MSAQVAQQATVADISPMEGDVNVRKNANGSHDGWSIPGKRPAEVDSSNYLKITNNRPSWSGREASGNFGQAANARHKYHGASSLSEETSIWDWDTPLESVGETSSYYYEPQGELLYDHRAKDRADRISEFNIPTTVDLTQDDSSSAKTGVRYSTASVAGVKRKAGELSSASAGPSSQAQQQGLPSTSTEETGGGSKAAMDQASPQFGITPGTARPRSSTFASENSLRPPQAGARGGRSQPASQMRSQSESGPSTALPARKVFPIQIGDKLFRLSGASISSDAPSYFSQFFEDQLRQNEGADSLRTLYIDRDPATFEDISLHLQGYHIEPRDGPHFVRLFADAQFFSLPRLTAQLFASPIYIRIGDAEFQIPRDLFSNPGDSPNYFSLGFSIFFTTPTEIFPGLNQRTLLRPPSILPPCVPNKSADTFKDILHFLKGYPVTVRNEEHRAELIRDARYFHLKGLEQRLVPHSISYNLARKWTEMVIPLNHVRASGISFVADNAPAAQRGASPAPQPASNSAGWVHYQRPYADSEAYSMILEIGPEENSTLTVAPAELSPPGIRIGRISFERVTLSQMTKLLTVIANKMNLPVTQPLGLMMMERGAGVASLPVSPGNSGLSEDRVKIVIGSDAHLVVDGKDWPGAQDDEDGSEESSTNNPTPDWSRTSGKRGQDEDDSDESEEWVVTKAQYRLRVQPVPGGANLGGSGMEVILAVVKLEAMTSERRRNEVRGFLT